MLHTGVNQSSSKVQSKGISGLTCHIKFKAKLKAAVSLLIFSMWNQMDLNLHTILGQIYFTLKRIFQNILSNFSCTINPSIPFRSISNRDTTLIQNQGLTLLSQKVDNLEITHEITLNDAILVQKNVSHVHGQKNHKSTLPDK